MYRKMIAYSVGILLLIGLMIRSGDGVKINNLQVPKVVRHDNPVVLDCDFTLEANDEDLVVKWYFNNNNRTLVYQWIPGFKKSPQGLGVLKGRLNLEYVASMDANSAHRALHIVEPDPELSGDYTCFVSTLQSEDSQTKSMLVFVPEKNLILRSEYSTREFIKVQCHAEGVFPKPEMVLKLPQNENALETKVDARKRGHLFDVTASVDIPTPPTPIVVSCELRIPQANYTKLQETVLFPESSSSELRPFAYRILLLFTGGQTLYYFFISAGNIS